MQRLFKVKNYSKNKSIKRDEIISNINGNINKVLNNLSSNFYKMKEKDKLNKIK